MTTTYDRLYAWVWSAFREAPFTMADFRATFPSPAPRKVLSDLRGLGYLESSERATYRCVPPEVRVARLVGAESDLLGLPSRSPLPHAYDRDTAVTIWTGGGYWTGFTRGFRPLHLRVRRSDLGAWRSWLRAAGARVTVEGARETLFGVVHVLHPATLVRSVDLRGVRVIPAREAYAYAAARPYLYEPILTHLRDLAQADRS